MRVDHVICRVPDIRAAHAAMLALGFAEAWPVGPFWRPHLTSGLHLGGVNLELFEPAEGIAAPIADTIVFAGDPPPGYRIAVKTEADPELLRLRGFSGEREEVICTNGFPPEGDPFDHFFCRYAPFLADRLAVAKGPFGAVREIVVATSDISGRFSTVDPKLTFVPGNAQKIERIVIGTGARSFTRENTLGFDIFV